MAKAKPPQPKFDPDNLNKSVISIPLLERMKKQRNGIDVIIDVNLDYHDGRDKAKEVLRARIDQAIASAGSKATPTENQIKTEQHPQYIFAKLEPKVIRMLVQLDSSITNTPDGRTDRTIYKVWPDFPVQALVINSIKTVKADAARVSFSAMGDGIVWAVLDSGIEKAHNHFTTLDTINAAYSKDFTVSENQAGDPFHDGFGHGTHVAGVIAGEQKNAVWVARKLVDENDQRGSKIEETSSISGIASRCKLVSLKVLDNNGNGNASNTIRAINHIQQINGYGRDIKIHGVNISIGHRFEPEWFACGQSPLCIEVNRLVKSGVVVVVAAGNSGYGYLKGETNDDIPAGISLSINDPGNADLAITVGSTHRDRPHEYGVSYFSSKGPTGDGRLKPDLIAPGEKIVSCAAGLKKTLLLANAQRDFEYCEDSGTSMAAPHVSGVIAAFLSIRQEFIGQPERIKEIFTSTATDLKRDKYFQGHGLVDLMRAIQSV